jgi:hypothetical protein
VASVSAATIPTTVPVVAAYNCPAGITNFATGCRPLWPVDPPLRSFWLGH